MRKPTPALATVDLRILKYFPFGEAKRLDVVAEFFNLSNPTPTCHRSTLYSVPV